MNIIFIAAFILAALMLALTILGVPYSEKTFKIVVLIILILATFGGTGWLK